MESTILNQNIQNGYFSLGHFKCKDKKWKDIKQPRLTIVLFSNGWDLNRTSMDHLNNELVWYSSAQCRCILISIENIIAYNFPMIRWSKDFEKNLFKRGLWTTGRFIVPWYDLKVAFYLGITSKWHFKSFFSNYV